MSEDRHIILSDGATGGDTIGAPEAPRTLDVPDSGYAIAPEPEDDRTEVITYFLVTVDADGKAIATSKVDEALAKYKPRREANIEDFRRACTEVVADVGVLIQTQSQINTQMAMAQRMAAQAENQKLLQGLDLSGLKSR